MFRSENFAFLRFVPTTSRASLAHSRVEIGSQRPEIVTVDNCRRQFLAAVPTETLYLSRLTTDARRNYIFCSHRIFKDPAALPVTCPLRYITRSLVVLFLHNDALLCQWRHSSRTRTIRFVSRSNRSSEHSAHDSVSKWFCKLWYGICMNGPGILSPQRLRF